MTAIEARLANIDRHWTRPGVAADLALVSALEPFSIWSLFVGGPGELARYSEGAALLTDDRMTLEFSAPRAIHAASAGENGATLTALLGPDGGPSIVRQARTSATAAEWRNRGRMMTKRDAHAAAYDDYVRALRLDPTDAGALDGLVRTAILTGRGSDALAWVKALTAPGPPPGANRANHTPQQSPDVLIAIARLLAAIGSPGESLDVARQAARISPVQPRALEQVASLHADASDTVQLDAVVGELRQIAPDAAATHYYAAVAALLHGRAEESVQLAARAIAIDPQYAPVYDLIGAAYTKLGQPAKARDAFQTSLRFDAHDSTAYTNLGVLELGAGNRDTARRYFAEALWLTPDSATARAGLAQAK